MELISEIIYCVRNDIFTSNTYLLKSRTDNSCLIIDPGLSPEKTDGIIQLNNFKPVGIIATHGHFDHMGSVSFFKEKYVIPFCIHQLDLKLSQSANFYLKLAKINHAIKTPQADIIFKSKKQNISFGDFQIEIGNFPGHTAGSCIINFENFLFTGDLIYKNGLGFNNFPGENKYQLRDSILELFNTYPNEFLALPGHGQRESLQNIKNHNLELKNFLNL